MKKIKSGFLEKNSEYIRRLNNYILKNNNDKIESFVFSEIQKLKDFLERTSEEIDLLFFEENPENYNEIVSICGLYNIKMICFAENINEVGKNNLESGDEKNLIVVDKFTDVDQLLEDTYYDICDEEYTLNIDKSSINTSKIIGVYSLANSQFQLPFSLFAAESISENDISNDRVLLLDMQENSGLKLFLNPNNQNSNKMGLEDLLVMTETGTISSKRLTSCKSSLGKIDIINPPKDSSVIADMTFEMWKNMINILSKELKYKYIIINFGTRCINFYDVLKECKKIYILKDESLISNNRLSDFYQESNLNEYEIVEEISLIQPKNKLLDISKIVEAWKWSEFGDSIRKRLVI
ncbi:hypothetical protein [Lachnobacterium bovis]|uniref:hypothetical protein n=1 Tax=Lachnobacterium bovis TaxID=140626 RepID=UPI0003B5B396|nr:hypothetical protein [Lachnobacterium bovis]